MVNKVILIGRIGKDPDIKTFDNGGKMAKFSLATTEKWKDKTSGETKERTEWHNIIVNGKSADFVEKYVKKGGQLYVEGGIRYREYEQDGQKKYITEIFCDTFHLLGSKSESQKQQPESSEVTSEKAISSPVEKEDDGDLPF